MEFDKDPVVVYAIGEVDVHAAPAFAEACETASPHVGRITVDLADVTFMDSSGLAVLVHAHRRGPVTIRATRPLVQQFLDITGLAALFAATPALP